MPVGSDTPDSAYEDEISHTDELDVLELYLPTCVNHANLIEAARNEKAGRGTRRSVVRGVGAFAGVVGSSRTLCPQRRRAQIVAEVV
jgi:hypothetical protein